MRRRNLVKPSMAFLGRDRELPSVEVDDEAEEAIFSEVDGVTLHESTIEMSFSASAISSRMRLLCSSGIAISIFERRTRKKYLRRCY